jgi:hypothetical protein
VRRKSEIDLSAITVVEHATAIDDHLDSMQDETGEWDVLVHRDLFFNASRPIAIARLAMWLRCSPGSFFAIASKSASQRAGTLMVYATSWSSSREGVFFLLEGM